nr:hypothetical protein [Tanacetum cinerariifolium]
CFVCVGKVGEWSWKLVGCGGVAGKEGSGVAVVAGNLVSEQEQCSFLNRRGKKMGKV